MTTWFLVSFDSKWRILAKNKNADSVFFWLIFKNSDIDSVGFSKGLKDFIGEGRIVM